MQIIRRGSRTVQLQQSEPGSLVRVARAGALVLAAVLGMAALPAPTAACSGFSCAGHDPVVFGCNVSTTTSTTASAGGVQLATVWNRYSKNCNANWGRAQLTSAAISRGYKAYVYISTSDSRGNNEFMCYPGPNNTGSLFEDCTNYPFSGYGGSSTFFSDMVDGTNNTVAEVDVVDGSGNLIAFAVVSQ